MKTLGLVVCVVLMLTMWVAPVRADEPDDLVDYLLKVRDGGVAVIELTEKVDIPFCWSQWKAVAEDKVTWESLPDYCRDDNTGKASALLFVASRVKKGVLRKPLGWSQEQWEVFVQFVTQ